MSDDASKQQAETVEDPEDDDLSELLDSALKDFKKKPGASAAGPSKDGAPLSPGSMASPTSLDEPFVLDPVMMQKAAADFHNMMRQLVDVQKVLTTEGVPSGSTGEGQGSASAGTVAEAGESMSNEEAEYAKQLLENLNLLADKAQKVSEASSEDHFKEALDSLHSDDTFENQFLPFIGGFMGTLLSKEMLYPSLTDIRDKYPEWLEQNDAKLSDEDRQRFGKQLDVIKQICALFEAEKPDDSEQVKEERFHQIVILLQKVCFRCFV